MDERRSTPNSQTASWEMSPLGRLIELLSRTFSYWYSALSITITCAKGIPHTVMALGMMNPPHLDDLIRESMDEVGRNVIETAVRLGCQRGTLSRLLNGKAGVSANVAFAGESASSRPRPATGTRRKSHSEKVTVPVS